MKIRLYIAGPMTGLPALNFPAFHAAAAHYRARGYEVINPAEINPDPTTDRAVCMRKDIAQLLTCHEIALLPGWQNSPGAKLERDIALQIGIKVQEAYFLEPEVFTESGVLA